MPAEERVSELIREAREFAKTLRGWANGGVTAAESMVSRLADALQSADTDALAAEARARNAERERDEYRSTNEAVRVCESPDHHREIVEGDGCLVCFLTEAERELAELRESLASCLTERDGAEPAEERVSELVREWRDREWDTFTYETIRRMVDEWSEIGDKLADALQVAERELTAAMNRAEQAVGFQEQWHREYLRLEAEIAEARESLDSCITERDGAMEDAELFLRERDEAQEAIEAYRIERDWLDGQLGDNKAALAAAEEREKRLREALVEIESELRFRASRSDGRGGLDPPYTPPSLLSMADLARAALAEAGSSQDAVARSRALHRACKDDSTNEPPDFEVDDGFDDPGSSQEGGE